MTVTHVIKCWQTVAIVVVVKKEIGQIKCMLQKCFGTRSKRSGGTSSSDGFWGKKSVKLGYAFHKYSLVICATTCFCTKHTYVIYVQALLGRSHVHIYIRVRGP